MYKLSVSTVNSVPYNISSIAHMWRQIKTFKWQYENGKQPFMNAKALPETIVQFITSKSCFELKNSSGEIVMKVGFKLGSNGKILMPVLFDAKKTSKKDDKELSAASTRLPQPSMTKVPGLPHEAQFMMLRKMREFGTVDSFYNMLMKS